MKIKLALALVFFNSAALAAGPSCSGFSNPLSASYPTLAAAQVDYPAATSLSDQKDWAYLQSEFNAGRTVPPRDCVYYLTQRLTIYGALSFIGNGPGKTRLFYPADTPTGQAGISIYQTYSNADVILRDFAMITDKQGNNHDNAILIQNMAPGDPGRVRIRDVIIRGNSDFAPYKGWGSGIDLYYPTAFVIEGVQYQGAAGIPDASGSQQSALVNVGGFGIRVNGDPTANIVTNTGVVRDTYINWTYVGIEVNNNFEGLLVDNSVIILVNIGVNAVGNTGPWFNGVRNTHVDAMYIGINVVNMGVCAIRDNMIFHNAPSVTPGVGVSLSNADGCTVENNRLFKEGGDANNFTHIALGAGAMMAVGKNQHVGPHVGVYMGAGANGIIYDERFFNVATPYQYTGSWPVGIAKRDF